MADAFTVYVVVVPEGEDSFDALADLAITLPEQLGTRVQSEREALQLAALVAAEN